MKHPTQNFYNRKELTDTEPRNSEEIGRVLCKNAKDGQLTSAVEFGLENNNLKHIQMMVDSSKTVSKGKINLYISLVFYM